MHTNTFSSFTRTNTFPLIYLMNLNPNSFFFFFFQLTDLFICNIRPRARKWKNFFFFFSWSEGIFILGVWLFHSEIFFANCCINKFERWMRMHIFHIWHQCVLILGAQDKNLTQTLHLCIYEKKLHGVVRLAIRKYIENFYL